MIEDPIVEEVRAARDAYARQFGYDLQAIVRDLRERQEAEGRKVVSFEPKRKTDASVAIPSQGIREGGKPSDGKAGAT